MKSRKVAALWQNTMEVRQAEKRAEREAYLAAQEAKRIFLDIDGEKVEFFPLQLTNGGHAAAWEHMKHDEKSRMMFMDPGFIRENPRVNNRYVGGFRDRTSGLFHKY